MNVLINHPYVGSMWLEAAYYTTGHDGRQYVVGDAWDDSGVGSPLLPEDWRGEPVTMNFLAAYVRKELGASND